MTYKLFIFFICCSVTTLWSGAQTAQQGFFLDNWLPKTISVAAFDTVPLPALPATVMVTVDADSVITKVSRNIYGHNAAAWGGKLEQSSQLVKDITHLAPQVIRWPGGSMSDNYFWKASSKATCPPDLPPTYEYADLHYGSNHYNWTMSVDSYYSLLSKTGSTGIITINYAYARYGTGTDPVLTAAKYAADWVRYDNGRTRYWEIGNENMGSWESGYKIDTKLNKDGQPEIISGDLYGKHCRVFIDEMRKAAREVGNDIKIGVVAMEANVTWDAVQQNWNRGMMKQVADKADFIIHHSYFTPYNENSTVSTILNSPFQTKDYVTYINSGLKTHAGHDPLPIALTEWNIFATGSKQGVSYINGIHAALLLGEVIRNKYGEANRWDFVNGWDEGNNHGLFADGEPGIARYTPRAPFFYMYYFQKYFGDKMVLSSVTGSSDVISYASRFSSGQSGIVLVNKGTSEKTAGVTIKDFKPGNRCYYYLLTGGTDNGNFSRRVYVNGKTTTLEGGGPADYATMKPYGSLISGEIKISLPKLSAVFLLVENDPDLLPQTIQFDSIPSRKMGSADFGINGVSSSGLTVDFATSNPKIAIVTKGMVKITGAGTCDITAVQDGDTTWAPAPRAIRKLTVAKGDQNLSFPEIPVKTVGEADFLPGATASSGLPCTFTSSNPAVATMVNGMIQIKGKGTTVITAKQTGNVNYNAAPEVSRELLVTDPTGIRTFTRENDFTVYPNPASGFVTIRFNLTNPGLFVCNAAGQVVCQHAEPVSELTIPVREIGRAGVYFVKAGTVVKKLIIGQMQE